MHMKKTKVKLEKIPSVLKNVTFPDTVILSSQIPAREGSIILVEAVEDEGKLNVIDFTDGRLGRLWRGDTFPAVLGYRKAITEFAGIVPEKVLPGDELYLLCESGVVGSISGVFESWGNPMKVKVLGSILDAGGKPLNLKDFRLQEAKKTDNQGIPLIIFLGTRMDCGKTTMACKIAHELKLLGKKVAGAKLTGVAFTQDLMKLKDAGVSPVYDFVDMGLPSTCNGSSHEIVVSALTLINAMKEEKPDCILIEFGDAVMGEYHVADVLQTQEFKSQIKTVILAANDLAGVYGTKDILSKWGITIDLVTGPIANSKIGVDFIKKYFQLPAESNQHEIPNTLGMIEKKIFSEKKEI